MWVIFLAGAMITAVAMLTILKIGHKVWLSMKRDERKLEKEEKE